MEVVFALSTLAAQRATMRLPAAALGSKKFPPEEARNG